PAGVTPLDEAGTREDTRLLELILRSGGGRAIRPGDLTLPLRRAIRLRWRDGMVLLAAAGADPNARETNGPTPAAAACAANDREMLGWLLAVRADPARRDAHGRLLVERAAAAGRGSLVKLLLDYGSPPGRSLAIACSRGDGDMARLLLACGALPDSGPAPLMENPLANALRAGDDELATTLAGFGSPSNQRLPEGQTLLHLAIIKGCHRTVKLLLDAGADPNLAISTPVSEQFIRHVRPGAMTSYLRNDRNLTPLMLAADAGVAQTVQHLLAAGAKKNVWTRVNRLWPINFAAERGEVDVMRAMLGQDPEHEERRIVISLSAQQARMYDAGGSEIFNTKVSTGRKGYSTRTGEFVITDKNRTWTSTIYHSSMPYFQRLSCSDFGLHQGYVPGYPASHGCIRVPTGKAAELFRLTKLGDRVQIIP
ncbi:MAG: ankyrin repeat domain-containing protein, partial [Akkermansiaceae bacterium]|nr:ankyrin repeat domain-containing protein [Akkermansiaceae bacterium]